MTAAQDQDVALVSHALDSFQGGGSMREAADAALARIDQRLAAGAAMAAVVDECVKAGHITAVPPRRMDDSPGYRRDW